MYPKLVEWHLGGHTISLPTYGLLVATGFVVGTWLCERDAKRCGNDPRVILDACFWALIGGLVGARLLYVATNARDYWQICRGSGQPRGLLGVFLDCTQPLQFWQGGIVYYGGFVGGALGVWWSSRGRFLETADMLAPSVAIGHVFGRLGCYFAGCCFGAPTRTPFGARFPRDSIAFSELAHAGTLSPAAVETPPLHPTQLYEAAGELAIFALLLWFRPRKRQNGELLLVYLVTYPLLRIVVEMFRGDTLRKFLLPNLVSTSQAISLVLWIGAWFLYRRLAGAERPGNG